LDFTNILRHIHGDVLVLQKKMRKMRVINNLLFKGSNLRLTNESFVSNLLNLSSISSISMGDVRLMKELNRLDPNTMTAIHNIIHVPLVEGNGKTIKQVELDLNNFIAKLKGIPIILGLFDSKTRKKAYTILLNGLLRGDNL